MNSVVSGPQPDFMLSQFPALHSATIYAVLACDLPDLDLYLVHVRGRRLSNPDGIYLLAVYHTADAELILQKQYAVERSPLKTHVPLTVDQTVHVSDTLALLCDVGTKASRLTPFRTQIKDPSSTVAGSHEVIADLAEAMQKWNPAIYLDRVTLSGYEWLQRFTPFTSNIVTSKAWVIGRSILRNPVLYATRRELWSGTPPIIMPTGYVHGRLDVDHLYLSTRPFLVDVRGFEIDAPVLLDWASLELSVLLHFMSFDSQQDWAEWTAFCESICRDLIPHGPFNGRNAPHAADLIRPLRAAVDGYMSAMPASLRDWVEIGFWTSAVMATLRFLAQPSHLTSVQNAALVYGAYAFEKIADALNLPQPDGIPDILEFQSSVAHVAGMPSSLQAMSFEHGYALVIGVGKTQDPRLTLEVTHADADAMANFLKERAGYPAENVQILTNENATATKIALAFETLCEQVAGDPEATVIVYYSGHGGESHTGTYYLIPHETNPLDLENSAIPMKLFDSWIARLQVKRLAVFLDCCHAGSATLSKELVAFRPKAAHLNSLRTGSGRSLISSSTEYQQSYVLSQHANSLFTEVLLQLLSQPGEVEVLELFPGLRDEVARRAISAGVEQTPRFNAADLDRIVLAVS